MPALGVMGVTTPAAWLTKGGVGGSSTLGAASSRSHKHFVEAAGAFGADQPLAPIWQRHLRAIPPGLFDGIGLDLMAAIPAPHNQANASSS